MSRFVLKKVMHALAVVLIVSFALAFLLDLAPGDPAYAILGEGADPVQVEQVRESLGLNDPFYERYGRWLSGVAQGDFGTSYRTHEDVSEVITSRLPVTAELVLLTIVFSLMVSIPVGVYSAYRADGRFDRCWRTVSSGIMAFPPFVTALVLVFLLALQARWLPVTGWTPIGTSLTGNLKSVALPGLTLALYEIPQYSRLLRADMVSTLQEDYILMARAKGLRVSRILMQHALRPSSFTLITLVALSAGRLIGGAIIVESLFALPGLGQVMVNSTQNKDVLVVQGVVMFVAIAYVVLNALIDVIYRMLDPRVRTQEARA